MSDEKPNIEDRIRRDVESILVKTGRTPKLVYLVSQVDADTLIRGDIAAPARFQLATSGGTVGVAVDRWCPVGSVHRAYECSCGALFVDDSSRSGKCPVCMMNSLAETICELRSEPAVSVHCARCSATIDPVAVEQHHERCFRVGDYVRWEWPAKGRWAEGTLLADREVQWCKDPPRYERRVTLDVSTSCSDFHDRKGEREFGINDGIALRHIQRPGQAVRSCCPGATTGHDCGCDPVEARADAYHKLASEAPGPIHYSRVHDDDDDELQDAYEAMEEFTPILPPEVDPLDVVYDGLTLRELIRVDEDDRRETAGPRRRTRRTDSQRAAVSAHWSADLRQRISAAKERERLSVTYCEVDVEDEPW